jgi:hypothetical protein
MNNLCCWFVGECGRSKERQKMKKYEERNAIEKIEVKPVWLQKKVDLSFITFSKTFLCYFSCLQFEVEDFH